jgi:hypothetical protein
VTYPITALPYGMRDVKLTRYTDASGSVLDTVSVDLPNMQTFSFSESEEYTELRGDDRVVAIRGKGAIVEWSIESGGMDFRAWEILTGGHVALYGLAPNRVWTLRKRATDARPYFRAEGRAISESGGDMHCVVYRCRANDTVEGEFADGDFFITSASGQGLPMLDEAFDLLYEMKQYETATALVTTPVTANPTAQAPPTSLATAAGAVPATQVNLTWVAAAGAVLATDYQVQFRPSFGDWADANVATSPAPTTTSATVQGLTTVTSYQFRVRAVTSANGASDWTAPAARTTA